MRCDGLRICVVTGRGRVPHRTLGYAISRTWRHRLPWNGPEFGHPRKGVNFLEDSARGHSRSPSRRQDLGLLQNRPRRRLLLVRRVAMLAQDALYKAT